MTGCHVRLRHPFVENVLLPGLSFFGRNLSPSCAPDPSWVKLVRWTRRRTLNLAPSAVRQHIGPKVGLPRLAPVRLSILSALSGGSSTKMVLFSTFFSLVLPFQRTCIALRGANSRSLKRGDHRSISLPQCSAWVQSVCIL